jgi:hypothetical protein
LLRLIDTAIGHGYSTAEFQTDLSVRLTDPPGELGKIVRFAW